MRQQVSVPGDNEIPLLRMSALRIDCLRIYPGQLIPDSPAVELKAGNLTRQTGPGLDQRAGLVRLALFACFLYFLCNSEAYCLTAQLDSVSSPTRQITRLR
jgi:hypothetical protein